MVLYGAEVPPALSSHNINHILSHFSWLLVSENPPNFLGQEECPCTFCSDLIV